MSSLGFRTFSVLDLYLILLSDWQLYNSTMQLKKQCTQEDSVSRPSESLMTVRRKRSESLSPEQEKALPIIDLFLNPSRRAEKEDLLRMVHKEEGDKDQKQVKQYSYLIFFWRRRLPRHILTFSACCGSQLCPATRFRHRSSLHRLTCWDSASGRERRSTAPRSSNRWSPTLESVAPSTCKVIWGSPITATWSKRCRCKS